MLFLGVCLLCSPVLAQETAATRETLLDAMDTLWQRYGRQPTAGEIDEDGAYTSAQYLRAWETWDAVHQALAEHLYQKGLFMALGGDKVQAAEYYRRCLQVDPTHPQAQQAFKVDLEQAARLGQEFTLEKAGTLAATSYTNFILYRNQGKEQQARDYYMLARSQKTAYINLELTRLNTLFESAVTAYEQKEYNRASQQFQELMNLQPDQIGYEEAYSPRAEEITRYLASAQERMGQQRQDTMMARSQNIRFSLWGGGGLYARSGDIGLNVTTPGVPKLSFKSFIGIDLGMAYRLIPNLWAGLSWSQTVTSPEIVLDFSGFIGKQKIPDSAVRAIAVFLQPAKTISPSIRLYGQAGVARHSIKLSETPINLTSGKVLAHDENAIGGFVGIGIDTWIAGNDATLLGVRCDVKYHIVNTSLPSGGTEKLKLNGLRLVVGVIFSL